jgi:hypothetical protein
MGIRGMGIRVISQGQFWGYPQDFFKRKKRHRNNKKPLFYSGFLLYNFYR